MPSLLRNEHREGAPKLSPLASHETWTTVEPPDPLGIVKNKTNLITDERMNLLQQLLHNSTNWNVPRGLMDQLVTKFGVHRMTVR